MSVENVKKLYDLGKENEELGKEMLKAALNGNIVEFAKKKGFEFTKEEYDEFIEKDSSDEKELSDEQLEKVAGGIHIPQLQFKTKCHSCGRCSDWVILKDMKKILKFQKEHTEYTTTNSPHIPHLLYDMDERMH